MTEISLPIAIIEGYDLGLYEKVQFAEIHLEAIDVIQNVYVGYDAEGRKLDFSTLKDKVIIKLAEEIPTHQKEFEKRLRKILLYCKIDESKVEEGNLKELIRLGEKFKYPIPTSISKNKSAGKHILPAFIKKLFKNRKGI